VLFLWVRELRRMVVDVSAAPRRVHSDDLPASGDAVWLPLIHCRDCYALLVLLDVAANQVRGRRDGATFVRSNNDCPYCNSVFHHGGSARRGAGVVDKLM
jgi:hypothetical protein